MRPVSASMGFRGAGLAGADASCGDDEQAIIARAAKSVRSVFQIVVIAANHTFKFSSYIQKAGSGIKLTTWADEFYAQISTERKFNPFAKPGIDSKKIPQLFALDSV